MLAGTMLATSAMAANFDLDNVSPDAAAIVHVDLGALRHSALAPFVEAVAAEAGEDIVGALGDDIDVFKLLNSLTLYVVTDSLDDVDENNMVVMIDADNDLLELIDSFREEIPDIDTEREGGFSFERWAMDDDMSIFLHTDKGRRGSTLTLAFNDDLMVHALEILSDDEDSYEDAHGNAFGDADDAMIFVIANTDAAPELDGPGSMALEFAKTVSAMITNRGEDLGVALAIETGSVDDAQSLVDMVEGLMAMTKFAKASEDLDPEAKMFIELAESADIGVDGNLFTIYLELQGEFLAEMLEHADF
jgi:hypothetical protein